MYEICEEAKMYQIHPALLYMNGVDQTPAKKDYQLLHQVNYFLITYKYNLRWWSKEKSRKQQVSSSDPKELEDNRSYFVFSQGEEIQVQFTIKVY